MKPAYLAVLYFFFIVGFLEVHYSQINDLLSCAAPARQTSRHAILKRTTWSTTWELIVCNVSRECNQGTCVLEDGIHYCECDSGYLSLDDNGDPSQQACDYKQVSGLAALLISIFVGACGIDWCFLSRGNGCYIALGFCKGITVGGLAIWWIVDMIRIGVGSFNDGNGVELTPI